MDILWLILVGLGVYLSVLATFVVICGLNVVKMVFSGSTSSDQTHLDEKNIRTRDLHKHPEQAVDKITSNLWDTFLKGALKASKGWTGDEGESRGLSGLRDQFGVDDIADWVIDNPNKVKEFLGGLQAEEKGAPGLPPVKRML